MNLLAMGMMVNNSETFFYCILTKAVCMYICKKGNILMLLQRRQIQTCIWDELYFDRNNRLSPGPNFT